MQNLPSLHIVLRLPQALAERVRRYMKSDDSSNLPVSYKPVPEDYQYSEEVDFLFSFEDHEYPSLLINLPTPVEVHKTTDNKILTKAADIGQVFQVFEDINSLRKVKSEVSKSKTPFGECSPHGLTPPTFDIVHRRFEQTRVKGSHLPNKIRTVMNDIIQYSTQLQTQQSQQNILDGGTIIEVEEVVEFQDWMVDPLHPDSGRTIVFGEEGNMWGPECELLMYYPEILVTMEDREEDEFEKLAQAQKMADEEKKSSSNGGDEAHSHLHHNVEEDAAEAENMDDDDINMGVIDQNEDVEEIAFKEKDDEQEDGGVVSQTEEVIDDMGWMDSDDET